jgi:hypothetical protein
MNFDMYFRSLPLTAFFALKLCAFTKAHFVPNIITSLEFNDSESTAPCGMFDPTIRMKLSSYPVSGGEIGFLIFRPNVTWEYGAVLLTNLTQWASLAPVQNQTRVEYFCEPQIPAKKHRWDRREFSKSSNMALKETFIR